MLFFVFLFARICSFVFVFFVHFLLVFFCLLFFGSFLSFICSFLFVHVFSISCFVCYVFVVCFFICVFRFLFHFFVFVFSFVFSFFGFVALLLLFHLLVLCFLDLLFFPTSLCGVLVFRLPSRPTPSLPPSVRPSLRPSLLPSVLLLHTQPSCDHLTHTLVISSSDTHTHFFSSHISTHNFIYSSACHLII